MSSSIALRRSPKPGRLYRRDLEPAAQTVDDEGRQRFAFDILGEDQQGPARLHHGLENRQHGLQAGQLRFVHQDVRVFEFGQHLVRIRNEIRREVAAVELHAFDDVEFGVQALGFLDRDDAFIADGLHGPCDHRTDFRIAVGGDRANLRDLFVRLDLFRTLGEFSDDSTDGEVDPALQIHRIHAGRDRFRPFAYDGLRQDRGRRRAVAGDIGRLGRYFAHHLRTHILELVFELDFLGDGHAVLGDTRGAERLVDYDIAAFRAKRHFYRFGENINATKHPVPRIIGKFYVFSSHFLATPLCGFLLLRFRRNALDNAHDVGLVHDKELFAIELHFRPRPFSEQNAIAGLHVERSHRSVFGSRPTAGGDDFTFLRFFLCGIGNDDPSRAAVFAFHPPHQHAVMQWPELHPSPPYRR